MEYTTLIVPGLNNSGPDHWQTWLQGRIPNAQRVDQIDWNSPKIIPWARNVQNAILEADAPVILVAHSFGVLASVVGACRVADRVAGALYIAPADPVKFTSTGQTLPDDVQNWGTGLYNLIPKERLGYPTIIAASQNDPYMGFKRTAWWATKWQSRLVSLGFAGHVNVASGHGEWPQGEELYAETIKAADLDHAFGSQTFSWAY